MYNHSTYINTQNQHMQKPITMYIILIDIYSHHFEHVVKLSSATEIKFQQSIGIIKMVERIAGHFIRQGNGTHPTNLVCCGSKAPAFLLRVPLDYYGLFELSMLDDQYGFQHLS